MGSKGILVFEDGASWEGEAFGFTGSTCGEAVFNTAFTGYEELLTDPSYAGQIVVMASPHVGNYGISLEEMESSRIHLRGFVVKEASFTHSSRLAKKNLPDFLKDQKVFGLSGVDTRGIVKHLRKNGAMRAALSSNSREKEKLVEKAGNSASMIGASFLEEVAGAAGGSEPARQALRTDALAPGDARSGGGKRIVLLDFGMKQSIARHLASEGFEVLVLPGFVRSEEVLSLRPEGIVLSNGPGDPAALSGIASEIGRLMKAEVPILGICLGHQLLAMAMGGRTYKLKFGHRGVNHPVKNLETGGVAITSHNHGFSVEPESLPQAVIPTYQNLYDQTLEGFRHGDFPFSAVQFHPEAAPGPEDAVIIFSEFRRSVLS